MSKQSCLVACLVTFGTLLAAQPACADHFRTIRKDYEASRHELEDTYEQKREAVKCAYRQERERLKAARRRAIHIDCPETRSLRIRQINRELAQLTKTYHCQNRDLAAWYHAEREELRELFELAMRRARSPQRVVVAMPHPDDCGCQACRTPPAPLAPRVHHPRPSGGYVVPHVAHFPQDVHRHHPRRRKPTALDWASLVLRLMN